MIGRLSGPPPLAVLVALARLLQRKKFAGKLEERRPRTNVSPQPVITRLSLKVPAERYNDFRPQRLAGSGRSGAVAARRTPRRASSHLVGGSSACRRALLPWGAQASGGTPWPPNRVPLVTPIGRAPVGSQLFYSPDVPQFNPCHLPEEQLPRQSTPAAALRDSESDGNPHALSSPFYTFAPHWPTALDSALAIGSRSRMYLRTGLDLLASVTTSAIPGLFH